MALKAKRPRRSNKQKVWDFMRRNRVFRAGDVMMILDVDKTYLSNIFKVLELAGYLKLESGSETFNDRHYKLLKNTGIRSPVIDRDILKDQNTNEVFILDGEHPIQVADKLSLLRAMKHEQMTRSEILGIAGFDLYSIQSIRYMREFSDQKIMICQPVNMSRNGQAIYVIDIEKREALIQELEDKGKGNA